MTNNPFPEEERMQIMGYNTNYYSSLESHGLDYHIQMEPVVVNRPIEQIEVPIVIEIEADESVDDGCNDEPCSSTFVDVLNSHLSVWAIVYVIALSVITEIILFSLYDFVSEGFVVMGYGLFFLALLKGSGYISKRRRYGD